MGTDGSLFALISVKILPKNLYGALSGPLFFYIIIRNIILDFL